MWKLPQAFNTKNQLTDRIMLRFTLDNKGKMTKAEMVKHMHAIKSWWLSFFKRSRSCLVVRTFFGRQFFLFDIFCLVLERLLCFLELKLPFVVL